MSRNTNFRHGKKRNGNNDRFDKNNRRNSPERKQNENNYVPRDYEQENAIREFRASFPVCEMCGQQIIDFSNAINNRNSDEPVHFDCVIKNITETEKPEPGDKVTYIGQGKFAILHFDNPHDMRHFTILKTIEWEKSEDERAQWRDTMAGLYSQVK